MTGRIITVRHGKPGLSRGVFISAQGYGDWWRQYDEIGLFPGQKPPPKLIDLARNANSVFSSSMPRAQETAQTLAREGIMIDASPMFIEAPLPPPPWPNWLKLTPRFWGVLSRIYWLNGYGEPGMETREGAWQRVDAIIEKLQSRADNGDVLLCSHGYLNWMIARRMADQGWTCVEHRGGNKYWSWRVYQPAVTGV